MNVGGPYPSIGDYVKKNFKTLDFWIENLINSVGSILIPNNIKYPRTDEHQDQESETAKEKMNQRYHEPTSFRYLAMHLVFLVENVVLVTLSALNLDVLSKDSPLHDVFANPKDKEGNDNDFIKLFPLWTLGLFILALILKFLYYQTHAWPIPANCFTRKFLCPFDPQQKETTNVKVEDELAGKFKFDDSKSYVRSKMVN